MNWRMNNRLFSLSLSLLESVLRIILSEWIIVRRKWIESIISRDENKEEMLDNYEKGKRRRSLSEYFEDIINYMDEVSGTNLDCEDM